ncbi:MAG TPA: ABC transporter permease [Candidatus Thermoplasmatota archaeon]|nr:ABC transporter permease [Candidatus Thermoplasmatota archaeon]
MTPTEKTALPERHASRFRHELAAVGALWMREFKVFQREKSRVFSSMAQPILWILFIGSGFAATTELKDPRWAAVDYRAFMFPGVLAMSILFGTIFYGLYIVWDRKMDVLKEVLVAPVHRTTIFFGKVIGGTTEAAIQAIVLIVVGFLATWILPEWGFSLTVGGALLALVFSALLAIAFVSVGLCLGSFFESLEGFQVIVSFLAFPLFFLSGALFPVDDLPGPMRVLTHLNPVTYAVDGLRGAILGAEFAAYPVWLDALVIGGFGAVMIAIGTWSFSRMR